MRCPTWWNVSPRGSVYRVHVSNLSAVDGSNQKSGDQLTSWGYQVGSWNPVDKTTGLGYIPIPSGWPWDFWTINSSTGKTQCFLSYQLDTGFVSINNSWFATVGTLHEQRPKVVKPDFAGHRFFHTMLEMLDDVISITERISLQIVFMIFDI